MVEEIKTEYSDKEVISKIKNGEKEMFALLIRKYNGRLYRIGISIIKNDAQIEDLMQNTYIKAYEHLQSFEGRASFGTWLIRIMINECLAYVKKNSRYISIENNNHMERSDLNRIDDRNTPAYATLNRELGAVLESSLLDLPEKYRLVFVMREMEDMSIAETTEALGISESNVKVRLNRAKAMLRNKLNHYYKSDLVFGFHLTRCDRIATNVMNSLGIIGA